MNTAEKIIRKYQEDSAAQYEFCQKIEDQIKALESIESPVKITISDDVFAKISQIASGEIVNTKEQYIAFDDADISWYLKKYGKVGPEHDRLRVDFRAAIEESRKRQGINFVMWTFSQEEAKKLYDEVANYHGVLED